MPTFGLVGPSYTLDSKSAACQTCRNWYVEMAEIATGKSRARLVRSPGLKVFATPNSASKVAIASISILREGAKTSTIKTLEIAGGARMDAPTMGQNYPSAVASTSSGIAWTDTDKLAGQSGSAKVNLDIGEYSQYLDVTGFGLTLPKGSTIQGIRARVHKMANYYEPAEAVVMLIKGGGYGDNKATTYPTNTSGWRYYDYGGESDLWGTGFGVDDLNSATFGLRLQYYNNFPGLSTISENAIDEVRLEIFYTPPKPDKLVVNTEDTHDFVVGDVVRFSSVSTLGILDGWEAEITDVPDSTHFSIDNPVHPWTIGFYGPTAGSGSIVNIIDPYAQITLAAPNPYSVGTTVTITGATHADFLNGVSGVISRIDAFDRLQIPFAHADYPDTTDTGEVALGSVSEYPTARGAVKVSGATERTLWVVSEFFYEVMADGSFTQRGTLANDDQVASIAVSPTELCIASAGHLYTYNLATNDLAAVSDGEGGYITDIAQVFYLDGYFVGLVKDSAPAQFRISDLMDGTTWNALDTSIVSVFPDGSVSMVVDHRELWLLCATKSVAYNNTGNPDFPFEVNPSAYVDQGSAAKDATVRLDNSFFFIGQDDRGGRMAWRMQGYTPARVSNHAVEQEWNTYSTVSDAVAYGFQINGHSFWHIYFPTANKSWRLDVATGLWHEVGHWENGAWEAHRSRCHVFAFGKHLVGDWKTGNIYEMSPDILDDFGHDVRRVRRSPYISEEGRYLYFDALEIIADCGMVNPTHPLLDADGNPRDPEIVVRWSDDDGHTWSNERIVAGGKIGEFAKRLRTRRMGRSWGPQGRVYEIVVSDPVAWSITEATLEVS